MRLSIWVSLALSQLGSDILWVPRFTHTVCTCAPQAAVAQAAAALAQALAGAIGGGEGLPLARVVPAAESAAAALLAGPDNAVVAAVGRLPVVHELCAAAYANIPPAGGL